MRTVRKNVDRCRQGMRTQMWTQEHEQTIDGPPECGAHSAITTDRPIFIPSSGRTSIGGFLVVVAWRRGDARINFVDTADNCGQKVWTDADSLQ